jgi:hypothetical protein
MKWQSLHDKPILPCKICQKPFTQTRWNQLCCSKDCMTINYKQNQKAGLKRWRNRHRDYMLTYMRDYNAAHHEQHLEHCREMNQKIKENKAK